VLAFMVLTPATGDPATFPFLRHAAWDGLTASDLVLPTFLVTSGLSLAFLLRPPVGRRKLVRLVRRLALLVVLGLVYNAYGTSGTDLSSLRYTGVLQTIGVAGFLAAAVVLLTRRGGRDRPWAIAGVAVALPASYGTGLHLFADRCAGDDRCSPYVDLDRTLLGPAHTYGAGELGWDPEGIAATVAASALVLVGYLAGRRLVGARSLGRVLASTVAAAGALLAVAWALDHLQPANKRLLTPAFVAVASGVALLGISLFVVLLDVGARRGRATSPVELLVALGRNALVVYLLERFLLQTSTLVHVGDRTLREAVLDRLPVGPPGVHLAFTGLLLAVVVAVTAVLHRRQRYLAL
jgi:heparan-alpha-glucosaminide N-acetyltransferase